MQDFNPMQTTKIALGILYGIASLYLLWEILNYVKIDDSIKPESSSTSTEWTRHVIEFPCMYGYNCTVGDSECIEGGEKWIKEQKANDPACKKYGN